MACAACGKKYPGTAQISPEEREAARQARLAERARARAEALANRPQPNPSERVPIGQNRGYTSALKKVKQVRSLGGGPGFPEKLLFKGVK